MRKRGNTMDKFVCINIFKETLFNDDMNLSAVLDYFFKQVTL